MKPETHREIHELLTNYGYTGSEDCNRTYYRYCKADMTLGYRRNTVHRVCIYDTGFWEHNVIAMDDDGGEGLPWSGRGLDSLKADLQIRHGDVLIGSAIGQKVESTLRVSELPLRNR